MEGAWNSLFDYLRTGFYFLFECFQRQSTTGCWNTDKGVVKHDRVVCGGRDREGSPCLYYKVWKTVWISPGLVQKVACCFLHVPLPQGEAVGLSIQKQPEIVGWVPQERAGDDMKRLSWISHARGIFTKCTLQEFETHLQKGTWLIESLKEHQEPAWR